MWKVFCNGRQTSPTTPLRNHFRNEHPGIWESECCRLNIPRNGPTGQVLGWDGELFTPEGFVIRILRFLIGSDQVRLRFFPIFPMSLTQLYSQSM